MLNSVKHFYGQLLHQFEMSYRGAAVKTAAGCEASG